MWYVGLATEKEKGKMSKFVGLCLIILIMLIMSNATTTQQRFAKYQKIEAYEVRPGILIMPRYTADGEVCEIGLQRLFYSTNLTKGDPGLDRLEVEQILDELVPEDERGKPSKDTVSNLIIRSGQGVALIKDYEKVSIHYISTIEPSKRKHEIKSDEIIAIVKWKQRVCR